MANGVADGTGPILQHVVDGTTTAGSVAGTTVAGVKTTAGLGVADGTGPLLAHVTPTTTAATATIAGTTGAGIGAKTAAASKLAALCAAAGGVLGIVLAGAAVVGAGYLGYRLIKDSGERRRRQAAATEH